MINREFSVYVPHTKGGSLLGLVSKIISSRKMSNKIIFDYMGLIVNYLKKKKIWGSRGVIQIFLFEAYNSVLARVFSQADGKNESSGWYE